ncbi:PAS-domain containing protein [Magnetovibrio blakemorei]|uniref:PAS-domain containing protein n=1 Tax=Magnetovibrio blakemorei TaxID=28181 RepID=UPI0009FC2A1B|nr:PAS-domain containing protein [Magnetovibrio blakemorei]
MNGLPASLRWIIETLLLAVIYIAAGKVGHVMALPGTNATILWPPSGIALAAVLMMGPRSLAGLWLGALAINGWTLLGSPTPPRFEVLALVSSVMAFGSILQSFVGAWAVRRFSNAANPLSTVQSSIAFLAIAPLMCVLSSSIGALTLLTSGQIHDALFQTTLFTWWGGDTIGVILFTPFALLMMRMNHVRQGVLIVLLAIGFFATSWVSSSLRDQAERVWQARADSTAQQLTSTFLLWLDLSYASVYGTTALFSGSNAVDEDEFLDTVDNLEAVQSSNFPSSMAYVLKTEDGKDWTIAFSTSTLGILAAETTVGADAKLSKSLAQAWSDSGKLHLSTGVGDNQEILLITAMRTDSQTQEGVLVATIDLSATLDGLFARPEAKNLTLRLSEEVANNDGEKSLRLLYGGQNAPAETVRTVPLRTISGSTVLDFRWDAAAGFAGGIDLALSDAIMIGGTISTVFITLFTMFLLFQNESIKDRVRERTEEVTSKTQLLQAVMGSMGQGIAAFDRDLKMVAFNKQFLTIRGYPEDLVFEGQDFKALIEYDVTHDEFGPGDPEEILHEKLDSARMFIDHHFERQRPNGQFIDVMGGPIPGGGFVSTYSDITDRKKTDAKIEQQLKELDKARKATLNMMADAEAARSELQAVLNEMSASINYASHIQRSVLPDNSLFETLFQDHFVIWQPRDVVGGDMYWCRLWGDGLLVMLGDCTGHGVPGAFMTLIASGALDNALADVPHGHVGVLTQRIHQLIQTTLGQHGENSESDDGMELGVCFIGSELDEMIFVGARFELFIVENGMVSTIKGTKSGTGYRGISMNQEFAENRIVNLPGKTFYMSSDGLIDQVGEETKRSYGKKRFKELLLSSQHLPMSEQKDMILQTLFQHQGRQARRDDVSVIGFKL